jgi:branched-chain amino acid transport system ATP-binding protein
VILQTKALTRRFGGLTALSNVDFAVPRGSVRAIIGPNGAGKTTLFNLITGELPATGGTILFDGQDISGRSPEQIARLGVSRTFQLTSVFADLTARENVWLGINAVEGSVNPLFSRSKVRAMERQAEAVLAMVGLGGRADVLAAQLSYGQQRLLDIAIAISTRPRLLMLDEPTAGLGVKETAGMAALLKRLAAETSIVVIEHDIEVVLDIADAISVLYNGELILEGAPRDVTANETVQRIYLGHQASIKGGAGGASAAASPAGPAGGNGVGGLHAPA